MSHVYIGKEMVNKKEKELLLCQRSSQLRACQSVSADVQSVSTRKPVLVTPFGHKVNTL